MSMFGGFDCTAKLWFITAMFSLQLLERVGEGYRLPPPPGCPRAVYMVMTKCWLVVSGCVVSSIATPS